MIGHGSFFKLNLACIMLMTALIVLCACTKEKHSRPPQNVIVTQVIEKPIFPAKSFIGEAIARETVDLCARVTGFLVKKNFEDGSYVSKGDIIFVIEKDQYQADCNSAQGDLLQAEANYTDAKIEYERQEKLIKSNATSQQDMDRATQTKYSMEGALLKAKAELATANLNLSYTDVIAPCDGKLGASNYDVGNLVGSSSKPLGVLAMIDPIEIQFSISEDLLVSALQRDKKDPGEITNINKELKSQNVVPKLILSNGTEYPLEGRIYFVDNNISKTTGTINLRALFSNPNHLILPGAYVKVMLSQANPVNSLLVPQDAVQENQSGKFLYVVNKDKKVELRHIEVKDEFETYYIVTSGVQQGEQIIVEGIQKVKEGVTVNPIIDSDKNG
ncbi:MAG TPA: hypothetical protein DD381_03345 [Lentisphaeria bacterium]|nr:MAG: hypothetical protein A2X47_02905 [Lentisphaerae bacterium GWF2_38_69]HBM15367.1 hypothetical protein [Lentisphaeria bacterium]